MAFPGRAELLRLYDKYEQEGLVGFVAIHFDENGKRRIEYHREL